MHNARNRRAATCRRTPAFPADVVIPPHRGASPCSVEMPPPPAKAATHPAKSRAAPKRKKKPAQRRRKAAGKPRAAVPVIALPHRDEPLTESAIDLAAWSALAPPQPGPAPAMLQNRALAPYRSGGLLVAVADWLGSRTQQLLRRLGELQRPAPQRTIRLGLTLRPRARPDDELQRLRAENERLRHQLDALLTMQSGASGKQADSPA